MMQIVAIPIIKGEHHEGSSWAAIHQSPGHGIERQELETRFMELIDYGLKKFRGDFKKAVRGEGAAGPWPDTVKRKDYPMALRKGSEPAVGPCEADGRKARMKQ